MAKSKWLIAVMAFGLSSCCFFPIHKTDTSSEIVRDYHIDYMDLEAPTGQLLSQDEWNLLVAEAAQNKVNFRKRTFTQSEELGDYDVRSSAETALRSYNGDFQEGSWATYAGRKGVYTLENSTLSSDQGGYYLDIKQEEVFFIQGNDQEGYNLYFNHYQTDNGIEKDPYSTLYASSQTLETNADDVGNIYDEYIAYYMAYSYDHAVELSFSPELYEIENWQVTNVSFIKTSDGKVYVTNYNATSSLQSVTVDGETKRVPVNNIAGTQVVYTKIDGLGYCLTKYLSLNINYMTVDLYGERLSEPAVTYKSVNLSEWEYSKTAPTYEDSPTVITPIEAPFAVDLVVYNTDVDPVTILTTTAFTNVTGLYKQFIDPSFTGYAYQHFNYGHGTYKVTVSGPEGYSTLNLGYSDITNAEDFDNNVTKSTLVDNGIDNSGSGSVSYLILLNSDGALVNFTVAFLI